MRNAIIALAVSFFASREKGVISIKTERDAKKQRAGLIISYFREQLMTLDLMKVMERLSLFKQMLELSTKMVSPRKQWGFEVGMLEQFWVVGVEKIQSMAQKADAENIPQLLVECYVGAICAAQDIALQVNGYRPVTAED